MTLEAAIVNTLGIAAVAATIWYFRPAGHPRTRGRSGNGVQSALVVVRGGYTPDTVVFERGRPARLVFRREESAACSERVILPAFQRSALLPEGEEVAIDFVPSECGEFTFTCHLGVLSGRIVVE